MEFLQELLKKNPRSPNEEHPDRNHLAIEIMAIPDRLGGGFHVVVPGLGRYFACADDDGSIVSALKNLESMLREHASDEESIEAYARMGITIPKKENDGQDV